MLKFEPQKFYERSEFYEKFSRELIFLRDLNELKDHLDFKLLEDMSFEKIILPFLQNKFKKMHDTAASILNSSSITQNDVDSFAMLFDNISAFETYSKLTELSLKNYIESIQISLDKKINDFELQFNKVNASYEELASTLISLKLFADNIISIKERINERIDSLLIKFNKKNENNGLALAQLAVALESDPHGVGLSIIAEHSIFKGQQISLFNQETQRHDIDFIMNKIEGSHLCKNSLEEECYSHFKERYENLVKENIKKIDSKTNKSVAVQFLVSSLKMIPRKLKSKSSFTKLDAYSRKTLSDLVAHILALWTLSSIDYYDQMKSVENRDSYLLTPHPGQVISIFRLLGIHIDRLTMGI